MNTSQDTLTDNGRKINNQSKGISPQLAAGIGISRILFLLNMEKESEYANQQSFSFKNSRSSKN